MSLFHFFLIVVAVSVAERLILRRQFIELIGIGQASVKAEALAFPVCIRAKKGAGWTSNARVEYVLRDLNNPALVITGKSRTFDAAKAGYQQEFLLINTRYLEPGLWDLRVRVINGNCRINPLYRIFPVQTEMTRRYAISQNKEGGWNAE